MDGILRREASVHCFIGFYLVAGALPSEALPRAFDYECVRCKRDQKSEEYCTQATNPNSKGW